MPDDLLMFILVIALLLCYTQLINYSVSLQNTVAQSKCRQRHLVEKSMKKCICNDFFSINLKKTTKLTPRKKPNESKKNFISLKNSILSIIWMNLVIQYRFHWFKQCCSLIGRNGRRCHAARRPKLRQPSENNPGRRFSNSGARSSPAFSHSLARNRRVCGSIIEKVSLKLTFLIPNNGDTK